jgi:hypothetical protein
LELEVGDADFVEVPELEPELEDADLAEVRVELGPVLDVVLVL